MTQANDVRHSRSSEQFQVKADGAGYIAPLSEGYRRKGGQNPGPAANSPRPPAPEPFRPAQPASPASTNKPK